MIKLNYTDYRAFSEQYSLQMDKAHEALVELSRQITDLYSNGVIYGDIHDELIIYRSYVDKAASSIEEVQTRMQRLLEKYLEDMNTAQSVDGVYILYDKNYPDLRDYTAENFERMRSCCESTDHDANIFQQINDWGEDIVSSVFYFLGKTFDWWNVKQTRLLVMEINEITEKRLKEIKLRIDRCESKYAQKAEQLYSAMFVLNAYLCLLQEIMQCKDGTFSASSFSHRLTEIYNGVMEYLDGVNVEDLVTEDNIRAFLELAYPEAFFKDSSDQIYDYLAELSQMGQGEASIIVITQMFDISLQKLKELFTDYSPEQMLIDKEMLALLDEMAERESLYDGTSKETTVNILKKLMGLVEKFGDNWAEHLNELRDENGDLLLDKRTKEYRAFKAFFDQFGNAEKILSYGGDLVTIMAKYVADYENCEKILVTLQEKCGDNPEMAASLERISKVYDKAFEAIAKDVFDKGIEYTIDALEKNVDKALGSSIFKIVGWVEMGIDITGKVTGLSEDAAAKMQLLATGYDQLNTAKKSFEIALQELQNCSPDAAGYEDYMTKFRQCFEYYRVTQKRLYAQMGKAENGVLGEYYRYCSEEMDQLSLSNFEQFDLLTFEEYKQL